MSDYIRRHKLLAEHVSDMLLSYDFDVHDDSRFVTIAYGMIMDYCTSVLKFLDSYEREKSEDKTQERFDKEIVVNLVDTALRTLHKCMEALPDYDHHDEPKIPSWDSVPESVIKEIACKLGIDPDDVKGQFGFLAIDENGNFLTEDEIEGLVPSDIDFVTKDELLAKLNGGDDRD